MEHEPRAAARDQFQRHHGGPIAEEKWLDSGIRRLLGDRQSHAAGFSGIHRTKSSERPVTPRAAVVASRSS